MFIRFFKNRIFLFVALFANVHVNAQKVDIIPYPNEAEIKNGLFHLSASTKIYYTKDCKKEASVLQKLLQDEHQLKLKVAEQKTDFTNGNIYLAVSSADSGTLGKE